MSDNLKKMVKEMQWRRWQDTNNIHLLSEVESTLKGDLRDRPPSEEPKITADDPTVSLKGQTPIDTDGSLEFADEEPSSSKKEPTNALYGDVQGLTDLGKTALKANTVWTNHLTQLQMGQAGKQLAQQIGGKLAKQLGGDPGTGEKIVEAVMKQVLEHLDDVATQDMEKTFPGIFLRTRG